MPLPMTVLFDVAMRLGTSLVVMPGADDAPLLDAARTAGVAVVDAAVVRENLVLLGDAGCAAAETRCLARLAVVSDAGATLAAVPVDVGSDRRDAVVVTAAGERRRVQSTVTALANDVAFALTAPAAARLRLQLLAGAADAADVNDGAAVSFLIDDVAVDVADDLIVRPGEHRVLARRGDRQARAVVVVEAGESVWVTFAAQDLAPDRAPTAPPAVAPPPATAGIGPAAVVGGVVVVVGTAAAAGMLGLAGAAVVAAEASDVQTTRAAQADAANLWGVGAGAALAVAIVGAGITAWSLAGEVP